MGDANLSSEAESFTSQQRSIQTKAEFHAVLPPPRTLAERSKPTARAIPFSLLSPRPRSPLPRLSALLILKNAV